MATQDEIVIVPSAPKVRRCLFHRQNINFSIDGISVNCNAVWTFLDPNLNDAGHGYPAANGNPPIIALDPAIVIVNALPGPKYPDNPRMCRFSPDQCNGDEPTDAGAIRRSLRGIWIACVLGMSLELIEGCGDCAGIAAAAVTGMTIAQATRRTGDLRSADRTHPVQRLQILVEGQHDLRQGQIGDRLSSTPIVDFME
jgi:hypothetical protein